MSRLLAMIGGRPSIVGSAPLVLAASGRPAAFCWRARDPRPSVERGDRSAILIRIGDGGPLARLIDWLLLPIARTRIERVLRSRGASHAAVYAVAPDCEAPMWVYRMDSPAAAYADTHLLPRGARWHAVRAAIRWWIGCDPAVAGLLIVGGR